jgi:cell division protease FtsH
MMVVPYAVLFILFMVLWYFMFNRGAGGDNKAMKFGKARTKLGADEKKKVTSTM